MVNLVPETGGIFMITIKSKKFLLAMVAGLVLASCGGTDEKSTASENKPHDDTSVVNSDNSLPTGESANPSEPGETSTTQASRPDFTASWTTLPGLAEEIQRYCGGHQIPFIDLQGDYHAVKVARVGGTLAHLLIYTSGSYDRTLVYNTKVTYELAGWDVTANVDTLDFTAEEPDTGIYIHMYGKLNTRDNSLSPYLEIYFQEKFKAPENGAWSTATKAVLAEAGIQAPHMLPYCYLGTYLEEATKMPGNKVQIKGGDWIAYERSIVDSVKSSLSSSRNWTYAKGTAHSGYNVCPSNVYTWTKGFSDGYTVKVELYGTVEGTYYSYSSALYDPFAVLIVSASRNK